MEPSRTNRRLSQFGAFRRTEGRRDEPGTQPNSAGLFTFIAESARWHQQIEITFENDLVYRAVIFFAKKCTRALAHYGCT